MKEVEGGRKIRDVCRGHGISEQTYHRWKAKYGGLGITEARRIAGMAHLYDIPVIPHAQSTYSYHFVMSQPNSPMAEYVLASPSGDRVEPFLGAFFTGEPLPQDGMVTLPDRPGWGMELRPDLELIRPISG